MFFGVGASQKRTRLVSPCHQLQFPYFKCSILIALKTQKKSAFRFLVIPYLILRLLVSSKYKDPPKHSHPFHIAYFTVLELRAHHSTALRE